MSDKSDTPRTVGERITDYLSSGGLFNPELANHDAVRDLLIDCRDKLAEKEREVKDARQGARAVIAAMRRRWAALHDLPQVVDDEMRAAEAFVLAWRDRAKKAEADAAALRVDLAERQAKIDRIMLEYCPDEMTQEQIAEWERHQRAAPEPEDCIVTDSARQA